MKVDPGARVGKRFGYRGYRYLGSVAEGPSGSHLKSRPVLLTLIQSFALLCWRRKVGKSETFPAAAANQIACRMMSLSCSLKCNTPPIVKSERVRSVVQSHGTCNLHKSPRGEVHRSCCCTLPGSRLNGAPEQCRTLQKSPGQVDGGWAAGVGRAAAACGNRNAWLDISNKLCCLMSDARL